MAARTAKRKVKHRRKRAGGRPFAKGFDKRRNLKGPLPKVHELREALLRDGPKYLDALFRKAMLGDSSAIRVAIEQMLGKPPQAIEVTGAGGAPIEVKDARERLLERVEKLLARGASQADAGAASDAAPKPATG